METANASFGQGISVTAVQLVTAMSAIANGGRLLEPVLVKRVSTSTGEVVREGAMHVRREAAPAHVTKLVAEMLTAVTEDGGTGVEAAVPGFRVAGKTATAQKVDPTTGRYSPDKFTASFVGFVPADKPRLVIAVVLDEPMIGHYGGDLAGPVFRRVAESSLRYLGVTPSEGTKAFAVARAGDPADKILAAYHPVEAAARPQSAAPTAQVTGRFPCPDASRHGSARRRTSHAWSWPRSARGGERSHRPTGARSGYHRAEGKRRAAFVRAVFMNPGRRDLPTHPLRLADLVRELGSSAASLDGGRQPWRSAGSCTTT